MGYDAAHQQTILVGGGDPNGDPPSRFDTWVWAGGKWTDFTPPQTVGAPPAGPGAGEMTYDGASGSLVILWGTLWAWNGTAWVDRHPAHIPPIGGGTAIAYDAADRKLVVLVENMGYETSTWTWNGVDFRQEQPAHQPPPGFALAAYDAARGVVVAFVASQTWTWNGSDWTQQHPQTSPLPRFFAPMTYDAAAGKVLLFGGKSYTLSGPYVETVNNELWGWDGTNWTQLA